MPVGTRRSSRRNLVDSNSTEEKSNAAVIQSPRKRTRGQRATRNLDAEETGSSVSAVQTVSAATSEASAGCDHQPVSEVEEISRCDEHQPTEVKTDVVPLHVVHAEPEKGTEGAGQSPRVDKHGVADFRTRVSEADAELGAESEMASEGGDVVRHVRDAYKKETFVRKQIKGKPKSGRIWKTEQTARFSDLRKDKPLKSSWDRKMAIKAERLSVRKFQQELQDAKRQAIELKKQGRAEHQKIKEENQKKSEVVQVIQNAAKLKRMKKKQLRRIEKR